MKIVIDRGLNLTRGDYGGNLSKGIEADIQVKLHQDTKITHTPLSLFSKYGLDITRFDFAKDDIDLDKAYQYYKQIRNEILNSEELKKELNPNFLIALSNHNANFHNILLQKITYHLDYEEDIDKISKQLDILNSNALFRGYYKDIENNQLVTYASREGIWFIDDRFIPKSAELRSVGKIRTDRALRSVKDPSQKIDIKRINYPLFEETKELIQNSLISNSYATREQADGTYKDDTPLVYVTALHFKEQLDGVDIEEFEKLKNIDTNLKAETTHTNKAQATKERSKDSLEKNDKEIHTSYDIKLVEDRNDDIFIKKDNILKDYTTKLVQNLQKKQEQELEELKVKINKALGVEREKVKQLFITSLANGMTISEAIDNLRASKQNDVMLEVILEELKSDIILSIQKDSVISEQSKQIEFMEKELKSLSSRLNELEKSNKTNYNNYIIELNKRKETEIAIGRLKTISDKLNEKLKSYKIDILELKDEIKAKDSEIIEQANMLDREFEEVERLSNINKKLEKDLEEKDKKIIELNRQNKLIDKILEKIDNI